MCDLNRRRVMLVIVRIICDVKVVGLNVKGCGLGVVSLMMRLSDGMVSVVLCYLSR